MASPPLPRKPHVPNVDSTSIFLPTVCLYDWWLIQADNGIHGKSLGVAGFTSPKDGSVKRAIRVFKSAPIIKVNDFYSLETADNVCVILRGLVNKSLSSENGFPGEVCKHFVFGFPVNWKKFVTEQGKSSPSQGIPYKQDQKSSREHKKFKKENQLCDRTKNNSTDSAKDYIEVDLPETVEEDRSIPVEKDLTSTCNHKNSESTSQPNVRTRNNCAAESAHSYLGSNHLRDDMKDPEEGSSSAHSVKSKSSPYDHKVCAKKQLHIPDQDSPAQRYQTCPYKQNSVKNANQHSDRSRNYFAAESAKNLLCSDHPRNDSPVKRYQTCPYRQDSVNNANQHSDRLRNYSAAESAKNHLCSDHPRNDGPVKRYQTCPYKQDSFKNANQHSDRSRNYFAAESAKNSLCSDHPRNDMEGTQEVPSSAPTFDQGTLCKPRNVKEGKERCAMMSKCAKKCINANCTNDGLKETRAEPSSTSSLSQPRRSSQYQMVSAKEDAAKSKATAGVIPNTQGIIMTPDSFKRSRSGRILLPKLAYWMNEVPIYDANRMVAGVQCPTRIVDSRDNEKVSGRK
ncbi:hypothetical protein SAY87_028415 [Trapa incisa]|uniref:SANTA domain-containing protein n=1 Tax=Trapa incisa TaxID=236973 RepID=A0AAN7KUN4_9MYRT|nr:hypothetical protein SAY87_028415 [Trapa incisa]